jgi:bifunctional pyridoxal-dependent enzyme with beta-cystathionase and maltose regulon repressor activities
MTYNFDEIIDRRHTNALNTDGFRGYIFHAGPEKVFAFKDEEFVRMWVADMEFGVVPEILDALRARIDRRIFGYTGLTTNITARSPSGAAITMTGAFPRSSCASRRASSRRSTS